MEEKKPKNGKIGSAAANLFPGYFALVMATGIISIAAHLLEMKSLAWGLLALNLVFYLVLWVLLLIRLIGFFPRVKVDVADHVRGPGFFTVVAGTCVLGSQLVIVAGQLRAAGVLWVVGLLLWGLIMYIFFTAITVRENKPSLESGLNGAWLIAAVATQSISVLGTLLANHFEPYREPLLFFTLCMFLIGCMLYLLLITLIFYRFTFFNLTTATLTPPYWINMEAVAITTLAGARLILAAPVLLWFPFRAGAGRRYVRMGRGPMRVCKAAIRTVMKFRLQSGSPWSRIPERRITPLPRQWWPD